MQQKPSDLSADLPVLVIPAYKPTEQLLQLVETLGRVPYPAIFVVDDGSGPAYRSIFEQLEKVPRVRVLSHAVNLGKGTALKTALNQVLLSFEQGVGAVTLDADGQHLPDDVHHVSMALSESPQTLHLGVRLFSGKVPLRSRFGNNLTRQIFRFLTGHNLRDTQTGLRGIPTALIPTLLRLGSRGYEFELDMLIQASQMDFVIEEVVIETVYENENKASHFNPIFDSLRIYFVFLRFLASSLASFALDNFLFVSFHLATGNMLGSFIGARVFSAIFNFMAVKQVVFKSKGNIWWEAAQYCVVVVVTLTAAYYLIQLESKYLGLPLYVAKLLAETILFFFNFAAQRTFIFVRSPQRTHA